MDIPLDLMIGIQYFLTFLAGCIAGYKMAKSDMKKTTQKVGK